MRTDWDAIVVGLGGIGSAAAYRLARRVGDRVLGLEQFELGHDRGASNDHSRIVRLSYHRPDYVRLARRAFAAWRELEADAGESFVLRTGGLDLWPDGATIDRRDYLDSLAAEAIPFELIDGKEVMRRWPAWRVGEGLTAIYQADAGLVDPARATAAHQRLAREHGATLLERTKVARLLSTDGGVTVEVDDGRQFQARSVIVATDAWTNDLLEPLGHRLPLTVTQEQVVWWRATEPDLFDPDRFPVWIWMDEPSFYGFPTYGEAGPKAGQDVGGPVVSPGDRTFEPDIAALARLAAFMGRHLPAAGGPRIRVKTCLYTLTPDRDFVVDRLPGAPAIVVALGAAHAFKFAPLLGQILADAALEAEAPADEDLRAFAIDRLILRESEPATRFLV